MSYNALRFGRDDLKKIMSGQKKSFSKTYKIPNGVHTLENGTRIEVKGSLYDNVSKMKDRDKWAKAEGFDDMEDMYSKSIHKRIKDFMSGKSSIYIYMFKIIGDD